MAINFTIDPKETALLVIDMQNGFCHPEGALGKAGLSYESSKAIIPNIKALVKACRERNIPILWSLQEHYPDDVTRKQHKIPSHMEKLKVYPCLKGTWDAELVDKLKSELTPEDDIFTKHRSSCFFNTNLETKLRMRGIKMLIICGVATNYCVESTIRDAYFRDYDILVPKDCVAGPFEDLHAATLKNVELFFGIVTSLEEIVKNLRGSSN